MRVLVCGSRGWADLEAVRAALAGYTAPDMEVIHGGAPGADRLAGQVALELGYRVRVYPANWRLHGRKAGIIRNLEMLDAEPERVLAFWDGASAGTKHTIDEAARRGIPLEVHRRLVVE